LIAAGRILKTAQPAAAPRGANTINSRKSKSIVVALNKSKKSIEYHLLTLAELGTGIGSIAKVV
jgi:hypothetical protein